MCVYTEDIKTARCLKKDVKNERESAHFFYEIIKKFKNNAKMCCKIFFLCYNVLYYMQKAMKKRQTEYTQAQRGLSPAERRPEPCGKPFTLELSVKTERASPVTERKSARILRELGWYRGSIMPSSLAGMKVFFVLRDKPRNTTVRS